jgi:hypothetical protein
MGTGQNLGTLTVLSDEQSRLGQLCEIVGPFLKGLAPLVQRVHLGASISGCGAAVHGSGFIVTRKSKLECRHW